MTMKVIFYKLDISLYFPVYQVHLVVICDRIKLSQAVWSDTLIIVVCQLK